MLLPVNGSQLLPKAGFKGLRSSQVSEPRRPRAKLEMASRAAAAAWLVLLGMVWDVPFPSVARPSEGSRAGFHVVKMLSCLARSPTRPAVTRGTDHTSQACLVSAL